MDSKLALVLLASLAVLMPLERLAMLYFGFAVEMADKSVLIVAMALVCIFFLVGRLALPVPNAFLGSISAILFLVLMSVSVAWITPLKGFENNYWFGFGAKITCIAILLAILMASLIQYPPLKVDKFLNYTIIPVLIAIYGLSVLQPPWAVHDFAGHTQYIVNELLAASNNKYPFLDFHSQYTSLLGLLFVPINKIYPSLNSVIFYLGFLQLFTVAVIIIGICSTFYRKSYLIFLATIPGIFIVKTLNSGFSGTISSLFANLPIRLLGPAFIFLYLIKYPGKSTLMDLTVLSTLTLLAILNNFESGIVVAVVTSALYFLKNYESFFKGMVRSAIIIIAPASFIGFLLYFQKITIREFSPFVFGFGAGFGSEPMPNYGLWVFVMSYLAFCVFMGARLLLESNKNSVHQRNSEIHKIAVILFFWGSFGLGMSPYYLNRSIVSGQLQFILCITFFATTGLLLYVLIKPVRSTVFKIILLFPACVSAASVVNAPYVATEVARLMNTRQDINSIYAEEIGKINNYLIDNDINNKNVVLVMDFGEIYSNGLKVKSLLDVNAFSDLEIIGSDIGDMCKRLDGATLVVTKKLKENIKAAIKDCSYGVAWQFQEIIFYKKI